MAKERPAAVRDAAREPISVSGGGTIPLAEVDATYYRLPQESMSRLWVRRTPERFVFDVKAHALMTGQPTETHRLPKAVRDKLPEELSNRARLYGNDLPPDLRDEIWAAFRRGIEPLRGSGKLGAVFLQCPRWVFPFREARQEILDTR